MSHLKRMKYLQKKLRDKKIKIDIYDINVGNLNDFLNTDNTDKRLKGGKHKKKLKMEELTAEDLDDLAEDELVRKVERLDTEDVDWELTLSLETTLQLLDEEINPLINTSEELIQRILDVCRGRGDIPSHLRGKVWLILLGLYHDKRKHALSDIYDLKEQHELRAQCTHFVATTYATSSPTKTDNETETAETECLTSTLESIVTSYLKESNLDYSPNQTLGYLQILKPLLTLNLTDTELYNLFRVIITNYVPRDVYNEHGLPFHIFRLLLLYHDPEVCTILDSLRLIPFSYAAQWFLSLFSSTISNLKSVLVLWDVYLQFRDPFLIYHMALVLVLNAKEHLTTCKSNGTSKQEISDFVTNLPSTLDPSDITDFLTIAQHYASQTPNSYRRMFESALYGAESYLTFNNNSTSPCRRVAMQSLCLPICGEELLNSIRLAKNENTSENSSTFTDSFFVRFFVVDCRPAEQYNSGHLPTAFHLDCALMLLEPVKFSTAVQGLLLAQKESLSVGSAAGGEHLCFVGSGREEEDQYVHMVVSSFLQRNTPKVGLLSGGYQSLHELLYPDNIEEGLSDHTPSSCPECLLQTQQSTTPPPIMESKSKQFTARLTQISSNLKQKSAEMKVKLIDYINNPVVSPDFHVKSSDKEKSKPYRNLLPVFMIEDDQQVDGDLDSDFHVGSKIGSIRAFLKNRTHYGCSEVLSDGSHFEGYVIVSKDNIVMVREIERDKGEVSLCRLLNSVIKITSKKKHPELITFKYGHVVKAEGEELDQVAEITHSDRFYLPSGAKDFVQSVKKFIDSN